MILATEDSIKLLYSLDSATVFNAVVESMGGSQGGLELEGKGGVPLNYMGGLMIFAMLSTSFGTFILMGTTIEILKKRINIREVQ